MAQNKTYPEPNPRETQTWVELQMLVKEKEGTGEGKQEDKEEEEEEDLLEMAGARGKWTQRMFLLCASMTFVVPLQSMSYQVLGVTPPHWCLPGPLAAAHWTPDQVYSLVVPQGVAEEDQGCQMYNYNYTLAASLGFAASLANTSRLHDGARTIAACSTRYFNSTYSTTVTEWDLVCERRALYSTTFSVTHVLRMVSCMSQGIVIDAFGRGRCAKICGTLYLVSCLLAACMPSLQLYLLLRGLVAVFEHYLYVACFVLSLELCTPKQRSLVGNLFAVPYALGYMALPGVALLVKDWRPLQLALSSPALFLLAYHWLLPESPRWLVTSGRLTEAADVLTQAAKVNGNPPLPRDRLMAALVAMHAKKENESRKKRHSVNRSDANTCHGVLPRRRVSQQGRKAWRWCGDVGNSVRSLVSSPRLVVVTLIVFYIWFTAAFTYYGISLYSVNLSTNQHLYLFLGGLLELPSYVLLWPLVSRWGRKKTNAGLYLIGGSSLLLLLLLQGLAPEGPVWPRVVASLVGKVTSAACYQLAYLLTGELYPTGVRSLAISLASVFSSIGAAVSSYLNDLLVAVVWWGPAAVYGVLSLAAALLTAVLPETTLSPLN